MDKIVGVELSHRFAPIEVREQMALNDDQIMQVLEDLREIYSEVFIIATCNRLSLYAFGDNYYGLENYLKRFGNFSQYLSVLPDTEIAIKNLFSTAAGLESQAIGEHQIVGQIRSALALARKMKTIGPMLDEMIRHAVHTGKRTRLETNIGRHSASLATVGFELIEHHGYKLEDSSLLVVGTGNMANLVATILDRTKIKKLFIASHNLERATEMAKEWNGEAIDIKYLHRYVGQVDIMIGGTQGEVNLLSEAALTDSKCTRSQFAFKASEPKLLIDFGLPRNFNPGLKAIDGVTLYDLDDIKKMTFESLLKRHNEIPQATEIVEEEVQKFTSWYYNRKASPVLEAYWHQLQEVKEEELSWLLPKMGDLTPAQIEILEKFSHRMVRKISKKPMEVIHELSHNMHELDNPINTVKRVFGLEDVELTVPKRRVIVGTRGSKLALTQTHQVIEQLKKFQPDYEFVTKVIRTNGDDGDIEVMGAFTTAIQRALVAGTVDVAVHSFKDLPIEHVSGLKLAAISDRADVRDILISKNGEKFEDLKEGAIIGTGSLRRQIQLKKLRPDIETKFIQGNLDTRIKKMMEGDYDAIILAYAGINRLGMIDKADDIFSATDVLPAVAQGALAIEVRDESGFVMDLIKKFNHAPTQMATFAEREFLIALGGGCNYPIAAYAQVNGDEISIEGMFATDDGSLVVLGEEKGTAVNYIQIARDLAIRLKAELEEKTKVAISESSSK
jgi:hydroxymethylbilane synthase